MSQTAEKQEKPEYNVIPVQLREPEFEKFIWPHLSLPKRGPECQLGYPTAFNYILKVRSTGRQRTELPIEKDPEGKSEIHYTVISKLFARARRCWLVETSLHRFSQTFV